MSGSWSDTRWARSSYKLGKIPIQEGQGPVSRVGNSLIGFLSELLAFCEQKRESAIRKLNFLSFLKSDVSEFSSFVMSDLSELLSVAF